LSPCAGDRRREKVWAMAERRLKVASDWSPSRNTSKTIAKAVPNDLERRSPCLDSERDNTRRPWGVGREDSSGAVMRPAGGSCAGQSGREGETTKGTT